MPKNTFNKLNNKKKKIIESAFYREFALKSFDEASVTQVVKNLGIAKGSIYQYFENKLELYIYLMMEAGALKAKFLIPIKREAYSTFWEYMKDIYKAGIEFDKNHFLESHFLFASLNNIESPSIKHVLDEWNKAIHIEFTKKVQYEVDLGLWDNKIPARKMAFILHQNFKSINEFMKHFHGLDIEKSIDQSKGIYNGQTAKRLLATIDEYFFLLKRAFDK